MIALHSIFHKEDEEDVLARVLGEALVKVERAGPCYVVWVKDCDASCIKTVKNYLRRAGYKSLAKRCVFVST